MFAFFRISLFLVLTTSSLLITQLQAEQDGKIMALLIDGQNNHNWRVTTPLIQQTLEGCGRFDVDVLTSPAKGESLDDFNPDFSKYDVVVSNYNGQLWNDETQRAFEAS